MNKIQGEDFRKAQCLLSEQIVFNLQEKINSTDDLNAVLKNLEREIQMKPETIQETQINLKYFIQWVKNMTQFLEKPAEYRIAKKLNNSISFIPKVLEILQKQVDSQSDRQVKLQTLNAYLNGQIRILNRTTIFGSSKIQIGSLVQIVSKYDFLQKNNRIQDKEQNYLSKMYNKIYVPIQAEDAAWIQEYCNKDKNLFGEISDNKKILYF